MIDSTRHSSVRVIFYYNNCASFEDAVELEKKPSSYQEGFRAALNTGERLLRQGLSACFSEVEYLTLILAATKLSSPQGLKELAGKTIVVVNPDTPSMQQFLMAYTRPENAVTEVKFLKASLDAQLKLTLEPVAESSEDRNNG